MFGLLILLIHIWRTLLQPYLVSSQAFRDLASVWTQIDTSGKSIFQGQQKTNRKLTSDFPTLFEVGLALLALEASGYHRVYGFPENQKEKIISILTTGEEVSNNAVVLIGVEKILNNVMGIGTTLILGGLIFSYFFADLNVSIDLSKIPFRDVAVWSYLIVWGILLINQILSMKNNQTSSRGYMSLPIVKRIAEIFSQKKGEEHE